MKAPALKSFFGSLAGFLPAPLRETLGQWLLRSVHEPDFLLFKEVADLPGLVLDVGANRGHAAVSVLRRTRRMRVLSLEPNPAMRPPLMLLCLLHPWRFRFRLMGAGYETGEQELLVPLGSRDLSSQASMDPAEFKKDYVKDRLAADGHGGGHEEFVRRRVRVVRVDDLRLQPDVIKLDVEGWEAQAIEGMQTTLAVSKPVLIIEINNSARWAPALASLGYRFYSCENLKLLRHEDWAMVPGLNMICCHPKSASPISRRILALASVAGHEGAASGP